MSRSWPCRPRSPRWSAPVSVASCTSRHDVTVSVLVIVDVLAAAVSVVVAATVIAFALIALVWSRSGLGQVLVWPLSCFCIVVGSC